MTDAALQTKVQHLLDGVWHSRRVAEVLPEIMAAVAEHDQTVLQQAGEGKDRYCGICYRPCIENGGWECPEHGYVSIYISRNEAAKLKDQTVEQAARLNELKQLNFYGHGNEAQTVAALYTHKLLRLKELQTNQPGEGEL